MLRCLRLRHVYRLGRTCTVRPGSGSGLSGVVPRGEERLSCTTFLQEDARWCQSWRCTTVRGFTAARAKAVKPKEAQRVVGLPVDPLNVLDASRTPPSKEELKEMLQAGGGVPSWQATAVTEWSERWADLNEEADRRQLLFSEGLSVLDRAIELVREQGARTNAKGGDVFTPNIAARLVRALLRDVHIYSAPEAARVRECCAQVASLLLSDEGRGLRKLTAQELAWVAMDTAKLTPLDSRAVSKVPRQVEAECVRRGLDKFKAADLGRLLMAWRTWGYKPGKELAEAVQERVMRRGYLTKGRGGQTPPLDVVLLLNGLLLSREEFQLQPAIVARCLEVMMLEGFLEPLRSQDLVFAMVVVRQGHRLVSGQDPKVLAGRIMRQLVLRMEGRAGQEAYDPSVTERWLKLLSPLTKEELSTEVVAVSRRLIERWAAAVEGGHHDISEPYPFFVQLDVCYRVGLLGVEGTEHIANMLNGELARLLRADGCSCFDSSRPRFVLGVLKLWRRLRFYPGDDLMDMMVDRFLAMRIETHGAWTDFLGIVVLDAERVHGYKPKAAIVEAVLNLFSLYRPKKLGHVVNMCECIEMLCTSSSLRQAQQPVVDAFLRRIGDPETIVKQACERPDVQSSGRLERAFDLLQSVASGGGVAMKGGEDGGRGASRG